MLQGIALSFVAAVVFERWRPGWRLPRVSRWWPRASLLSLPDHWGVWIGGTVAFVPSQRRVATPLRAVASGGAP